MQNVKAPWRVEYSTTGSGKVIRVLGTDDRDVYTSCLGQTTGERGDVTTEAIVRAVNAHDAMLNALCVVRMSWGWQHLSEDARALVEDGIARATGPLLEIVAEVEQRGS